MNISLQVIDLRLDWTRLGWNKNDLILIPTASLSK